jgi:hypothetical protein
VHGTRHAAGGLEPDLYSGRRCHALVGRAEPAAQLCILRVQPLCALIRRPAAWLLRATVCFSDAAAVARGLADVDDDWPIPCRLPTLSSGMRAAAGLAATLRHRSIAVRRCTSCYCMLQLLLQRLHSLLGSCRPGLRRLRPLLSLPQLLQHNQQNCTLLRKVHPSEPQIAGTCPAQCM